MIKVENKWEPFFREAKRLSHEKINPVRATGATPVLAWLLDLFTKKLKK